MKSESSFWVTQDLMCYLYLSQTGAGGSMDRQGNLKFYAIELIKWQKSLLAYYYLRTLQTGYKIILLIPVMQMSLLNLM